MTSLLNTPPEHETPDAAAPVLLLADVRPVAPTRRPRPCLYVRERARLRLQKVDVSERGDVADRLRITTVPTLVLVKGSRVVAQLEGGVTGQQTRRPSCRISSPRARAA